MTEDDAQTWIEDQFGGRVLESLRTFVDLVLEESSRQNLISAKTFDTIWARHIVDSAQLVTLATPPSGLWIDIGTGAGFPGMVTALLSGRPTLLVEPRRRRVDFLRHVARKLDLRTVDVRLSKIDSLTIPAAIISARAVAGISAILTSASQCADLSTQWLLPKGRSAMEEVAEAKKSWHGTFHVEHSITDPESLIVIASGVSHQ